VSKRSRALSSRSTNRSHPQPIHSSARGRWIGILAAACLGVWLAGGMSPASAQDSDGDGLSDADERLRVRTVPFGPQRVITTAANGATSILAADL